MGRIKSLFHSVIGESSETNVNYETSIGACISLTKNVLDLAYFTFKPPPFSSKGKTDISVRLFSYKQERKKDKKCFSVHYHTVHISQQSKKEEKKACQTSSYGNV